MTPVRYDIINEFEGNIHNNIIHDKNLYLILRETCSILNNILKNIPISNENEFIQNFIDAISELYNYTELSADRIISSISKSLSNFTTSGNDDLKNLKFEIYTFKGKESYDSLDYINERLENDYYIT